MKRDGSKLDALPLFAAAAACFLVCCHLLLPTRVSAAEPATRPSDPAASDPPPAGLKEIKAAFSGLANADPDVRSEAMLTLMGLTADDLPALKKVVVESRPLHPAQANALEQIVTHVFLSGENNYDTVPGAGFLGITLEAARVTFGDLPAGEPHAPRIGVVVTDRMPGFPGARTLQDGDVILSILDLPNFTIEDTQTFIEAVRDMRAGATVHFLILRHGQIVRTGVKLAPRPVDVERGARTLIDMRRRHAAEYWTTEFAPLVKERVS